MREKIIGILIPNIHKVGKHRYLDELCRLAENKGYKTMCFSSYTDLYNHDNFDKGEKSIYYLSMHCRFAGLVVYAELIKDEDLNKLVIDDAKRQNIPVFSIDKDYENAYYINYNDSDAIEKMTSHVIEKHGARDIYMISGMENNRFSEERNEGYRRALSSHGITPDDGKIFYGQFWDSPTNQAVEKIAEKCGGMPDAIVCANDTMAIAACSKIAKMGYSVPEDVIITGLDGLERALNNYPKITTACNDFHSAADYIVNTIDSIYNGEESICPHKETFGYTVCEGQSCGCEKISAASAGSTSSMLYALIDERQSHLINMDHMALMLNDGRNILETLYAIKKYAVSILYRSLEIYLDPTYFGYSESEYGGKVLASCVTATPTDLVYTVPFAPVDKEVLCSDSLKKSKNVIFVPIHCQEKVYGYIAADYDCKNAESGERLFNFVTRLNYLFSSIENSAKLNELVHTLNEMYIRDPLTNLMNRRGFYRSINDIIGTAQKENQHIMVVSVDLDNLKTINDSYGHGEGDFAIVSVANVLAELTGNGGICARFGGDEYLAALNTISDSIKFEKEFYAKLDEINKTSGKKFKVCASIGIEIVTADEAAESLQDVIKRADDKMFKYKRRNKISSIIRDFH